MRNKDLRLVVEKFKYYYKAVTKNDSYRFKMSDNRNSLILKFISVVKEYTNSNFLGEGYIEDYMEFQFNYWYLQDAKYGKGTSIQIEWIIGNKAWDRWIKRSEKHKNATSYIVRQNLKKDVKLKNRQKYNEGWANKLLDIKKEEEFEKEMFFNTAKGFVNCSINTTLYNHKSKLCMGCDRRKKCKSQLELQYPKVYKIRGY